MVTMLVRNCSPFCCPSGPHDHPLVPLRIFIGLALLVLGGPALAVDTVSDLPGPVAGDASDAPTISSPWGATSRDYIWTAQLGWPSLLWEWDPARFARAE